jgi:hypothetical protein
MAAPAHRLWWPATLTALARSTAVPAHRCSRSAAPTAGAAPRRGRTLRVAERFARRVHGDDDTTAGAKAENPAFPRRGSRVVPPWRGWPPRRLRALHHRPRTSVSSDGHCGVIGAELLEVSLLKLTPAVRVMVKQGPEAGARGDVFQPHADAGMLLREPARPDAVDEHPHAVPRPRAAR